MGERRNESYSKCGGRLEDASEGAAQATQPSLFVFLKLRWCSELSISTVGLMSLMGLMRLVSTTCRKKCYLSIKVKENKNFSSVL